MDSEGTMTSYENSAVGANELSIASKRQYLLYSTLACLATMLLFLVFRGSMPAMVPLQLQTGGVGGNHIPRDALVFGFPILMSLLNLGRGYVLLKANDVRVSSFYLIPVAAFLLAITLTIFALVLP